MLVGGFLPWVRMTMLEQGGKLGTGSQLDPLVMRLRKMVVKRPRSLRRRNREECQAGGSQSSREVHSVWSVR